MRFEKTIKDMIVYYDISLDKSIYPSTYRFAIDYGNKMKDGNESPSMYLMTRFGSHMDFKSMKKARRWLFKEIRQAYKGFYDIKKVKDQVIHDLIVRSDLKEFLQQKW